MKIGFYYWNEKVADVDYENIELGNPGIGGTEYMFVILIRGLMRLYPDLDITVYMDKYQIISKTANYSTVIVGQNGESILEVITHADHNKIDFLVTKGIDDSPIFKIPLLNHTKIITWGHNYYCHKLASDISSCKNIAANVFVSRQFYDKYIDHSIIKKSVYIYNFLEASGVSRRQTQDIRPIVGYIGSLVPAKGFLELAKVWVRVKKRVPDAELWVIGTGKLYSRNAKLGPYSIAEESYEQKFMKFLKPYYEKGDVKFLGILGSNKDEFISQMKVGVANPTAKTETFGISALDFEVMGVPVVTKRKNGLVDVVKHGQTGLLFTTDKQFENYLVKLLLDDSLNQKLGENALQYARKFSITPNVEKWYSLFNTLYNNESIIYDKPMRDYLNNGKFIRIINRKIKNTFGLEDKFSVLNNEEKIKSFIKKFLK